MLEVGIPLGACNVGRAPHYVDGRRLPYPTTDLPVIACPPQSTKLPGARIPHWLIVHAVLEVWLAYIAYMHVYVVEALVAVHVLRMLVVVRSLP